MRSVFLLSILLSASVLQAETLKVGALLDLSKTYAPQGEAFQRGLELAAEELNLKTPNSVQVFAEDTQYNAKNAISAAQLLITQKKVAALLTMTAIEQKSVVLMAKNFKVVTGALWDSSPEIESFGEYSFGFGPWTPATGEKAAEFATGPLQSKSAYIVAQEDEWSIHAGDYFKANYEKLGGKIIGYDKLEAEASDFRSTISKIKNSNADLVFIPIPRNISQFIKQAKQQSLTQHLVAADVLSQDDINNSQGAAEGVYHLEPSAADNPRAGNLYRRYIAKYGKEPGLKQFLCWGYDALLILENAWRANGQKAGKEFADQIRKTKDLETASGLISVTEKGSAPKYPSPAVVKDGKLVPFD